MDVPLLLNSTSGSGEIKSVLPVVVFWAMETEVVRDRNNKTGRWILRIIW
jgi:hypothetical protein